MDFPEFISEWQNSEESIKARTSGSTGEPKTIFLEKEFVAESARRTIDYFGLKESTRLHSCVGADFIGGKMMAVRALIANSEFSWEKPSNQPLKELIDSESPITIDLLAVVPSQMLFLLDNLENLPKISNIIIGGSAIHPGLRCRIAESGLNAYETYGMTETASHIALRKIEKETTPFKLLPGIRISKDNEDCLKITFADGREIQTNDIAQIIDGNSFFIKGRRDHIIVSGGKKINPFDIEARISSIIPSPFYVCGIPDEKWGEKLVLVTECPIKDTDNLKSEMRKVLESWELPKEIISVKKLPRTENGKIRRIKDLSSLFSSADDKSLFSGVQNKPE